MNFIFDLYGTLVDIKTDEEKEELWEEIACELDGHKSASHKIRSEYLSLCSKRKISDEQEINLLGVFEDMLELYGKHRCDAASLAARFRELSTEHIQVFDGVTQMLCNLKKAGAGVYLLSNAQSCFTIPELKKLGLIHLFDGIMISSDEGIKKPSRRIFELALDRFALSANECIYVGNDMHDDILGADSVGLKTVYIHTAQSGIYSEIEIPIPTYTAANHAQLANILLSLAK